MRACSVWLGRPNVEGIAVGTTGASTRSVANAQVVRRLRTAAIVLVQIHLGDCVGSVPFLELPRLLLARVRAQPPTAQKALPRHRCSFVDRRRFARAFVRPGDCSAQAGSPTCGSRAPRLDGIPRCESLSAAPAQLAAGTAHRSADLHTWPLAVETRHHRDVLPVQLHRQTNRPPEAVEFICAFHLGPNLPDRCSYIASDTLRTYLITAWDSPGFTATNLREIMTSENGRGRTDASERVGVTTARTKTSEGGEERRLSSGLDEQWCARPTLRAYATRPANTSVGPD